MKKTPVLFSVLMILALLSGCTSLKRYKSATFKAADNSLVGMDLFGYQLTPSETSPAGKNLWELSASAQTQLIQILDARYPDNTQFIQALNYEYLTAGAVPYDDYTGKNLRMVFTISKKRNYAALRGGVQAGHFSPADRIEYLKFSLKIPAETNLRFTEWNRFSTEYGEIEIGDISFTRSLDLDAEGTIAERADLDGAVSLDRTEKQKVRSRYLKLNGSISEHQIEIEEEGTREIDLTGNVIVDVSVDFSAFPERITVPLFSRDEQAGEGASGLEALTFIDVLVPRMEDIPDTITGILELEYVYRHVRSGWKTFQEWDDRVEYYTGTVRKAIPLFYREDYLPSFYCIGTDLVDRNALKIRTAPGRTYPLQFRSYSDASEFFHWLNALSVSEADVADGITIGSHTLMFEGRPLTGERLTGISGLKVMPVFGD